MNQVEEEQGALVLFSGGQDSATCLAWALERYENVETIGFHYGQVHAVEMSVRTTVRERIAALKPLWGRRLGADHVHDATVIGAISQCRLTGSAEQVLRNQHLPDTFVPGRNLVFLVLAAALAYRRSLKHLVCGVCETDYSGYPDCRDNTIRALQSAVNLGTEADFEFHTPLMLKDKAQTWGMARDLGGMDLVHIVQRDTHTCYFGDRTVQHDWGVGCGSCPACQLRARGWEQFRQSLSEVA